MTEERLGVDEEGGYARRVRRRQVIAWMAGAGALGTLPACKKEARESRPDPSPRPSPEPEEDGRSFGFFRPAQVATLQAMLDRLIPQGPDGFPGARDTEVIVYVDRQMQQSHFAELAKFVKQGVIFLDRVAKKERSQSFHELKPQAQDEVLLQFQQGTVKGLRYPTPRFFDIVMGLALEGHYGHPRHGGNEGKRTWKALGIDPRCPHPESDGEHGKGHEHG